jgi:hypothetical protein
VITVEQKGDFKHTDHFLKKMSQADFGAALAAVAREGVRRLAAATPIDSGLTADSWGYTMKRTRNSFSVVWTNSHVVDGRPIAILLQYGHGTGTGGYVAGRDYINPVTQGLFEEIIYDLWNEVTSA